MDNKIPVLIPLLRRSADLVITEQNDFYDLSKKVQVKVDELKETVLKSVLRQYLKREPTVYDAEKVTLLCDIQRNPDIEMVLYDNIPLGYIQEKIGREFSVTFTPQPMGKPRSSFK